MERKISLFQFPFLPYSPSHVHTEEIQGATWKGDMGSVPSLGRSPRGGTGKTLHYSCLENPVDRRPSWTTVQGVAKSWT